MTTNANFTRETTGQEVVDAFANEIPGKTGESDLRARQQAFLVVTGPSPGGIGAETARAIATKKPKLLILAGRSVSKLEQTRDDILKETPDASLALVTLDLDSLTSVRAAAKEISSVAHGVVDVLINNAAVMMCPYGTTMDGFETQFGTNYIAPWLLTNLLVPAVEAAPAPRVVLVSSVGHRASDIRWDDIGFSKGSYDKVESYGQSKTATILNGVALASKHPKITVVSLHPGGIQTNLGRHLTPEDMEGAVGVFYESDGVTPRQGVFFKSIPQGASTTLVAAFDPSLEKKSGTYLANCQVAEIKPNSPDTPSLLEATYVTPYAVDKKSAERLWRVTEEMVGEKF